jgi:hypothetical protein
MAPKSTFEAAIEVREVVRRLGELPPRHARLVVKKFGVPYTEDGIGHVKAALADCGLRAEPPLSLQEPKATVRVVTSRIRSARLGS